MIRQLFLRFERSVSKIIKKHHGDQQEMLLQTMATIVMTATGGLFALIFSFAYLFSGQITFFWFFFLQAPYSFLFLLAFQKGWLSLKGLIGVFVFSTAIFTTSSVIVDGGLSSAFLPWLSLTPLVGFVLLGRRGLLIWGWVSLVLMGTFMVQPDFAEFAPKMEGETQTALSYSILYIAEMATVAIVVWMRRRWAQSMANLEAEMAVNQKRAEARREGEGHERARILELLNQELEPLLFAAEVEQKKLLEELNPAYPDSLREGLIRIRAESERIVRNLSKPVQSGESLQETIRLLADDLKRGLGVEVVLDLPEGHGFSMNTRHIHLFRIIQEACRNVSRHAHASRVEITLKAKGKQLQLLQVKDDGIGWPPLGLPSAKKRGQGLQNITDRVTLLGGNLDLLSPPEGGALLECHFLTKTET